MQQFVLFFAAANRGPMLKHTMQFTIFVHAPPYTKIWLSENGDSKLRTSILSKTHICHIWQVKQGHFESRHVS